MALFPENMPRVEPEMDDADFWQHCREQRLCFQTCGNCGKVRHPPTPVCGVCHSTDVTWTEAPAVAELYSYTVVHYPSHAAVRESLPYTVGLITFPDLPGVRLVSNVTDCPRAELAIGMVLELWWDDDGTGQFLPRFRPARVHAASV